MVMNSIDSMNWGSKRRPGAGAGVGTQNDQDSDSNRRTVSRSPEVEATPSSTNVDQKPSYRISPTSMQETPIGSLSLKVGEPYWYLHQGNCEHIWTVDEIRSVLPLLPPSPSFSLLSLIFLEISRKKPRPPLRSDPNSDEPRLPNNDFPLSGAHPRLSDLREGTRSDHHAQ